MIAALLAKSTVRRHTSKNKRSAILSFAPSLTFVTPLVSLKQIKQQARRGQRNGDDDRHHDHGYFPHLLKHSMRANSTLAMPCKNTTCRRNSATFPLTTSTQPVLVLLRGTRRTRNPLPLLIRQFSAVNGENQNDHKNDDDEQQRPEHRSLLSSPATCIHIPLCRDIVNSIRTLPEVEIALSMNPGNSAKALLLLRRAVEVFQSAGMGCSREANATMVVMANRLGLAGRYLDAADTYHEIKRATSKHPQTLLIPLPLGAWQTVLFQLAESKARFLGGNFVNSMSLSGNVANRVIMGGESLSSSDLQCSPSSSFSQFDMRRDMSSPLERRTFRFFRGCALNGKGLAALFLPPEKNREWEDSVDTVYAEREEKTEMLCSLSTLEEAVNVLYDGHERAAAREAGKTPSLFLSTSSPSSSSSSGLFIDIGSIELGLAAASAMGNFGVAQALILSHDVRDDDSPLSSVAMEASLKTWRRGISLLESLSSLDQRHHQQLPIHLDILASCIRARLLCNVAWMIIFKSSMSSSCSSSKSSFSMKADDLRFASAASKTAIQLYEQAIDQDLGDHHSDGSYTTLASRQQHGLGPAMGRALGLAASCHALAGSAVTAEGLFRTAIDDYILGPSSVSSGPFAIIDAYDCLQRYADLCENWENRNYEAKRLRERADDLLVAQPDETQEAGGSAVREGGGLSIEWRRKCSALKRNSGVLGGLRFHHPGDFI